MRPLSAEEEALWRRVIETVRPLDPVRAPDEPVPVLAPARPPAASRRAERPPAPAAPARAAPGTTLDAGWDRRLARGLVAPDRLVDLHGHSLASAYDLLDRSLETAIADGARLLLLVTGKAPAQGGRSAARGRIRAAVGDWLASSRHSGDIAAVRNAHQRHGGAGALYIILRRRRERRG